MKRAIIIAALLACAAQAQDAASWWGALAADKPDVLNGMIAWWKFDDSATNKIVADSVGTNIGTSIKNTSVMSVAGKNGAAFLFNGSSDYVVVNKPLTFSENWTISFWVIKQDKASDNDRFISFVDNADNAIQIITDDASQRYAARVVCGGNVVANNVTYSSIEFDCWSHFVAVYNGTNFVFYRNANPMSVTSTGIDLGIGTLGRYFIGTRLDNNTTYLKGTIDDVRVYNRALSSSEVNTVYNRFR